MKHILIVLTTLVMAAGMVTSTVSYSVYGKSWTSPAPNIKIPAGYRDWRLISVAHEAGTLNDVRAILGNNATIAAYRDGRDRSPEGAMIARLAWEYVPSEQNNKVFGREQSFIAGRPTNVQFMIKDSDRYASTGGWGFAQFTDGRPINEAEGTACFSCHRNVKDHDFVFTHYAP